MPEIKPLLDFAKKGVKLGLDTIQWRISIEERPFNRSCYGARCFRGLVARLAIANGKASIVIEKIAQEEIFNVKKVLIAVVAENFCGVVRKFNFLCFGVIANSSIAGLAGQMATKSLEDAVLL